MDFKELLDYCKLQAITNTLLKTEVSVWRELCRNYSKKFSTPLHLCLDGTVNPEDILLAEFEDQLSEFDSERDIEAIMDQIYMLEDPDYEKSKREELEEFIDKAEKQEAERIRLGKPIHKDIPNETTLVPQNTSEKPKELPKSGGINFSYLANSKNEG